MQWCLSLLLFYSYFYSKSSDELRSLVSPIQTFTDETYHATCTELNYPNVLQVSTTIRTVDPSFSQEIRLLKEISMWVLLWRLQFWPPQIIIYRLYFHNLHFLLPSLLFISHTSLPFSKATLYTDYRSSLVLSEI